MDKYIVFETRPGISGPLRIALSGVQIRSFVQAWVLIQKEQGATNSQRKTELVGRLMNIVYNPSEQNSAQFKASNLNIVREIYDARVTLEDIIMTSIMNSLPRGGYQSARITMAEKIDDDAKADKDVYDFIQFSSNILELVDDPKTANPRLSTQTKASAFKTSAQNECHRCGRTNHKIKNCFASRHADGHALPDQAPGSKPSPKASNNEEDKHSPTFTITCDEERTKMLQDARAIMQRMEAM